MFCRVEILKGEDKRVICAHYKTGASLVEIEVFAEGERRRHTGDGFRIRDLHTDKATETWGPK